MVTKTWSGLSTVLAVFKKSTDETVTPPQRVAVGSERKTDAVGGVPSSVKAATIGP